MIESPTTSLARPPAAGFVRRHGGKLVASLVTTVGIVLMLHKGGFKFVPDGGDFGRVRWITIPAYVVTTVAWSYFRAVRWRFLLKGVAEVPRRRILAVSWIGFCAILLMPFRLGEFVRPYMIRDPRGGAVKPGGGRVSLTAATSSVVAERVIDGLYLSLILAAALVFVPTIEPLPAHVIGLPERMHVGVLEVRAYGFSVLGLFLVAFAVIAVFYFARGWAHRVMMATVGRVSPALGAKLAATFEKFADGLGFLGSGANALGFLVETTLYWGLNALSMWVLAWGCGVVHADGSAITFGETCAMMGMLGVTILVPGPPGLIGVFQLGICAGLTMYFPEAVIKGAGAAYIFILYIIQFAWTILSAAIFLVGDRTNWRAFEEAEGIVPAQIDAT